MSEAPATVEAKPKGKSKKLFILIGLVLLLGGGGAGAWFSGILPKLLGKGPAAEEHAAADRHGAADAHGAPAGKAEAKAASPVFMDLPDIVANLNAGPRRASFVKLKAKLELTRPEDLASIQAAMPRVLDLFQGYLREMRPEELRGTAGTYRLREELLARTNVAAAPARVVAILFTEMLVQ